MSEFFTKIRNSHNKILSGILFLLCASAIMLLFPREAKFKYEFDQGATWQHEDLLAPFDFAIRKSQEEIDSVTLDVQENTPPFYELDPTALAVAQRKFTDALLDKWHESSKSEEGASGLNKVLTGQRKDSLNRVVHEEAGLGVLAAVYDRGIIDLDPSHESFGPDMEITVIENKVAVPLLRSDVLTLRGAVGEIDRLVGLSKESLDEPFLSDILEQCLGHNLFFDASKTQLLVDERLSAISTQKGKVVKGTLIVRKGEIVDDDIYEQLASLKLAYETRLGGADKYWIIVLGQLILILLCLLCVAIFMRMFNREVLQQPRRVLFVLLLICLMVLMAKFAIQIELLNIYLAPICMLPIVIRTFYEVKLALFLHIITVFLISFIVPNPFEFVFLQIIAGILVLYGISNLRRRSQFFNSALVIFIAYSVTYFGLNILQEGKFDTINWNYYGWFGGNAMLSLFAYPLIYMFEKSFGFLSEITLLEISDSNNTLLRELNEKAPGTFQHSLQVANLAESAIRHIGGDALLVRAGALYHDIGKMNHPQFFIENQASEFNPHDELEYEESARIIINHVIDGIELAKKNNLPDEIIDFIRTHHGTTRTEYFYRMQVKELGEDEVNPADFTYPGPKPYSRETAVLMMADAVEAASKSLPEKTSITLEKLVDNIIDGQVAHGQFENSNMTFRNVSEIKKIFWKKLMSIYHVRIEYPE